MEQLTEYLQALHRAGLATGDHTTLLLNCYTKLGRTTDLKNFIMVSLKNLFERKKSFLILKFLVSRLKIDRKSVV